MEAAVFLDRDNTIIHNDGDLGDPEKVSLIKGAASAVASLRGLGFRVIVVSNQGGVARGRFGESDVDAVNRRINDIIRTTTGGTIDRFYYCPYHPDGSVEKYRKEHPWRKPSPGMITQAAKDLKLDLSRSWTIGDAVRDVQAGAAAGTRTILLRPKPTMPPSDSEASEADYTAESLIEAVRIIAQQRTREAPEARAAADAPPTAEPLDEPKTAPRPARPTRKEPLADTPASQPSPVNTPRAVTVDQDRQIEDEFDEEPPTEADPDDEIEDQIDTTESPTMPPAAHHRPHNDDDTSDVLLRQILHEMRDQREAAQEFSYTTVMAIVLQMLAAVFLLASFYFGWDNQDQFIRWMGAAMLTQMATIAMLLFGR